MAKPKPIEQNPVFQKIIEHLKERGQLFPEQIARDVGCNSRSVLYYVERYPEIFAVERLGGTKRAYLNVVRLRAGGLTRQGKVLAKVFQEYE